MNVMMSSTISNKQSVCPGEQLNFTCVTMGSLIIGWEGEYIGARSRVEFAAVDLDETIQINHNTLATLVSSDYINGTRVLTSRLMITVSRDYQNPSVTCLHVGSLINASISFSLLGIPGAAFCPAACLCIYLLYESLDLSYIPSGMFRNHEYYVCM